MGMQNENTAVMNATSLTDSVHINEEMFHAEMLYQAGISIAKTMLKNGLVTPKEYAEIDTILLKKYAPYLGTLLSENA